MVSGLWEHDKLPKIIEEIEAIADDPDHDLRDVNFVAGAAKAAKRGGRDGEQGCLSLAALDQGREGSGEHFIDILGQSSVAVQAVSSKPVCFDEARKREGCTSSFSANQACPYHLGVQAFLSMTRGSRACESREPISHRGQRSLNAAAIRI